MTMVMMMMTVVSNESPLGLCSPNETVDSAVRHHIDDDTSEHHDVEDDDDDTSEDDEQIHG